MVPHIFHSAPLSVPKVAWTGVFVTAMSQTVACSLLQDTHTRIRPMRICVGTTSYLRQLHPTHEPFCSWGEWPNPEEALVATRTLHVYIFNQQVCDNKVTNTVSCGRNSTARKILAYLQLKVKHYYLSTIQSFAQLFVTGLSQRAASLTA